MPTSCLPPFPLIFQSSWLSYWRFFTRLPSSPWNPCLKGSFCLQIVEITDVCYHTWPSYKSFLAINKTCIGRNISSWKWNSAKYSTSIILLQKTYSTPWPIKFSSGNSVMLFPSLLPLPFLTLFPPVSSSVSFIFPLLPLGFLFAFLRQDLTYTRLTLNSHSSGLQFSKCWY